MCSDGRSPAKCSYHKNKTGHEETSGGDGCLLPWLCWRFHEYMHMSKLIKLNTLNTCSFWHIDYTSIKLFKNFFNPNKKIINFWLRKNLVVSRQPEDGQHGGRKVIRRFKFPRIKAAVGRWEARAPRLIPRRPGQSHFRGSHQNIPGEEYCSESSLDSPSSSCVVFGKLLCTEWS